MIPAMRHRELHPILVAIVLALVLSLVDDPLGWSEEASRLALAALVVVSVPLAVVYAFGRPSAGRSVSWEHRPRRSSGS